LRFTTVWKIVTLYIYTVIVSSWQLLAGKPTSGIIKDTVNVARNSTVEVDVVANNPGPSLLHCHMQQHMDYGFKLLLKYT
jgi:FtsP/CotA-like multicopper oxidase with cupredoxin domain